MDDAELLRRVRSGRDADGRPFAACSCGWRVDWQGGALILDDMAALIARAHYDAHDADGRAFQLVSL